MPTCFDVANYFLSIQDKVPDITNMKLQKLCYYAQGFTLALLDKPLFAEEIQAWKHGPVIPELYKKYQDYGEKILPVEEFKNKTFVFTDEEIEILNEVYNEYGQFTAWKLREFTHQEPTWIKHYHIYDNFHNEIIPLKEMKEFFKTEINYE